MIHPSTPTSTLPSESSPPLFRDPNRPLPNLSSISHRRRWLTTLPIFLAVLIASAAGIFNYQKVNSPIIAATLYALRTNTTVREVLGDEVYFASKWAWVWGSINLVHGKVDVRFGVKGTRGKGMCRFRARRVGGRGGMVSAFAKLLAGLEELSRVWEVVVLTRRVVGSLKHWNGA